MCCCMRLTSAGGLAHDADGCRHRRPRRRSWCRRQVTGQEDLLITKRQWGAFHGTPLDQLLRRRGIKTIVMGGIATNFGVESTARAAIEQGYAVVFAEDAMTTMSAEMHQFAT